MISLHTTSEGEYEISSRCRLSQAQSKNVSACFMNHALNHNP